ncbi:MAG: YqeG family HAD IIIA-type phosphatase [Eubacteriales bacterium]|nr:YqeG family HAD IIIA-type phosphatase [Eubacteriales bacterium]
MSILQPDLHFKNVTEINIDLFKEKNIKFIIFDIDNTLAEFNNPDLYDGVKAWLDSVLDAGFKCCLVSNNCRTRVEEFNKNLGFYTISRAAKPFSFMLKRALRKHGYKPENTCVIGDQIFSDIMAANLGGMLSILVDPLSDAYEGKFVEFKRKLEKFVITR